MKTKPATGRLTRNLIYSTKPQHRGNDAVINILQANYRNAPHVTALANRLLRLKQARFSAIDRESHHLVRSYGRAEGIVRLL